MENKSIVIVGAGFTGAYIARNLAEQGWDVKIVEEKDHIAGHVFDKIDKETGCMVHEFGPHVFHTNDEDIWKWLNRFSKFTPFELSTRVFFETQQDWFICSFGFHTIEQLFSEGKAKEIIRKLKSTFPDRETVTVPELLNADDEDIREFANILWEEDYKPYTAKQWGLKPSEVDQDIFKRVPVYMSYHYRYNNDKYEALPDGGYTSLFTAILAHDNIKVQLGVNALKGLRIEDNVVYYEGEETQLVFTGAIDELFGYEFGELKYRSLTFEREITKNDKNTIIGDPCVDIYPNAKYGYTRITNYGKLPIQNELDYQISCKEYSHEFRVDGDLNRYYPTLTDKDKELLKKYEEKSKNVQGLYLAGRLAKYKYYNMDGALIAARDTLNEILK